METRPGVIKVLQAVAEKPITPKPDESLFDSGLLDSFSLNDLVLGLEDEFGISVPDSDISARKFDTIARIEQYVDAKKK